MVVVNVFAVAAMFLSSAGVSGGDKAGSELAGWLAGSDSDGKARQSRAEQDCTMELDLTTTAILPTN